MKAILLDKATIGFDIDFSEITKLCNLVCYNITPAEKTSERIKEAEIIITNKVVISKTEFEAAKKLKLICVAATGYNNIDIKEAEKRNIIVANVKGYSSESVAQTVFGYILTIMNSVSAVNEDIKTGLWQKSKTFTLLNHSFLELSGKNLGIIGYGTIGKRVSEIAKSFGMNILVSKSLKSNNPKIQNKSEKIKRISFYDLLKKSDIISIHVPLSSETENLISEKEFSIMKKTSILINTARGGIVNEKELYNALKNKLIRYAATDVLIKEPPSESNILFDAPNIIITPHIAWTSYESRKRLVSGIAYNIKLYKTGNKNFGV